jgi:hypothetical protein
MCVMIRCRYPAILRALFVLLVSTSVLNQISLIWMHYKAVKRGFQMCSGGLCSCPLDIIFSFSPVSYIHVGVPFSCYFLCQSRKTPPAPCAVPSLIPQAAAMHICCFQLPPSGCHTILLTNTLFSQEPTLPHLYTATYLSTPNVAQIE